RGDQIQALVGPGVAVEPGLLLVGGTIGDRLDIFVVALVLRCDEGVLVPQVRGLLAQPVREVRLLRISESHPCDKTQTRDQDEESSSANSARPCPAGNSQSGGVSHC